MKNTQIVAKAFISIASLIAMQNTQATSFISFDSRTMAMGGAGIAESEPGNGALLNPALTLSNKPDLKNTSFSHLYLGARLIDRDGFIDKVKELDENDFELAIDSSLDTIKRQFSGGNLSSSDLRALSQVSGQLLDDVASVANRPLRASASFGFSAGHAYNNFAYAAYARKYYVMGAVVNLASIDVERLQQLITASSTLADVIDDSNNLEDLINSLDLETIETLAIQSVMDQEVAPELLNYTDISGVDAIIAAITANQPNLESLLDLINVDDLSAALLAQNQGGDLESIGLGNVDLRNYLRYQIPEKFESTVDYSGAEIEELALSFSTNNFAQEKLTLGLNLKRVNIDIIEFSQTFDRIEFGDYKLKSNRKNHAKFNMDIGAVYQFNNSYTAGLVVRNLIPYTLNSISGTPIEFKPIARVGMAYNSKFINAALDYDLTKNETLGFDPDKQYLSAGIEWTAWKKNAVRAGYRYNTVDQSGLPSIGLGLGFQQGHIDIAVTRSGKEDEYGLSLQAGFQF